MGESLDGEGDGVDVGAVVGDDGESEDDETEFAKAAQRLEGGVEQAAVARGVVAGLVLVVAIIEAGRSHDGYA